MDKNTSSQGRKFAAPAKLKAAFLKDNPLILSDVLFDPENALGRAFDAGYDAAYRASKDPNDTVTRPLRDEQAEWFVRKFIRLDGRRGIRNRQLEAAFAAWIERERPDIAPMVLSKHCTRALHRKMDALELGHRGRLAEGPGRVAVTFGSLPAYIEKALADVEPRESNTILSDLYPIIACWVDDHVFVVNPSTPDIAATPTSIQLWECAESVRKHYGDEAPVERASNRAINRVVNKILDTQGIGERAVNNGSAARRGIRILPRPIEEMIEAHGRDYWAARVILRD